MSAPRTTRLPPSRPRFFALCRFLARVAIQVLYRPIVVGGERVPDTGGVLIAANHQSYIDPPFVGCWVKRHLTFIARSGLFKSAFMARLIGSLNSIPIAEEGSDTAAMKAVLEAIADDRAVLIFPEGSRTEDGGMHEFKRGASVVVKRARCPVVPVGIEGAWDAWPRGRKRPRLFGRRLAMVYREPIPLETLEAEGKGALALIEREVTLAREEACRLLLEATRGRLPSVAAAERQR